MAKLAEFTLNTPREGFIDVTVQVCDSIAASGVMDGIALTYCPHTTAGITINENADPDVLYDLLLVLDAAYPDRREFRHAEGNSAAHLKASAVGSSATIIISGGKPVLGTWQGMSSSFSLLSVSEIQSSYPIQDDWMYAVVATRALSPIDDMGNETIMRGSVSAHIARNAGVLTDKDTDAVETRVIEPISFENKSLGLSDFPHITPLFELPGTGDTLGRVLVCLAVILLLGVVVLTSALIIRKHKRKKHSLY